MIYTFITFLISLILLIIGASFLIKGVSELAKKLKLSEFFIATVIIGLGTSIPDIMIAINSAINKTPDIAIGNIIGSSIMDILIVIGLSSIIYPIKLYNQKYKLNLFFFIIASCISIYFIHLGYLSRELGFLLILLFIIFVISSKDFKNKITKTTELKTTIFSNAKNTIIGLTLILIGYYLFGATAKYLETILHLSNSNLGILIVAPISILPETFAVIMASIKHKSQIIIGTILGSVFTNLSIVLGIGISIEPIIINNHQLQHSDLSVLIFAIIMFLIGILFLKQINRLIGIFFILCYSFYILHTMLALI